MIELEKRFAHCLSSCSATKQANLWPFGMTVSAGPFKTAAVDSPRTTRVEAAARRRLGQVWGRPAQASFGGDITDLWEALNEMDRVGMPGASAEDLDCFTFLNQTPCVDNADPVGDVGVDRHVMCDENEGRAKPALNLADHGEDVALDDDIERAVVGSSATITSGAQIVASAMVTRCRMPPESWCG